MKQMNYNKRVKDGSEAIVLDRGEYKSYKYVILNLGSHPTAYIENKGKLSLEEAERIVFPHGGWSYCGDLTQVDPQETTLYIGWDYCHFPDCFQFSESFIHEGKRWTTQEIYDEVKEIIDAFVADQKETETESKLIEPMFNVCKDISIDESDLKEVCLTLYRAGYQKIEQALTEFVEKIKRGIIKGDGDEEESEFTRGYNCACDSHTKAIDQTLQEYLNSLKNQNQGD